MDSVKTSQASNLLKKKNRADIKNDYIIDVHLPSDSCHAVKNLRDFLMSRVVIWDRLRDW